MTGASRPAPPRHQFRGQGPPGAMLGRPVEKARDFRGTLRRLLRTLRPHAGRLALVGVLAVLATLFTVLSPRLLGSATTLLFRGLHAGVDFAGLGRILVALIALYVASAGFTYAQQFLLAGVTQRVSYDLRRDIDDKLARLPSRFFDEHKHGEIMSRVANDVDVVSSSLQQGVSQLLTSTVTIAGMLIMMLSLSPVLTLIAAVVLPTSLLVTARIARRSQRHFAGQQKTLGELSAHVEECYGGHVVVKAFGRERRTVAVFDEINQRLYAHGWRAQFISGVIFPVLSFLGNVGYVAICIVGGLFAARRRLEVGDIQAFIQYSRQFTQPIVQAANVANVIQSSVAAAERVFEILQEPEETADPEGAEPWPAPRGEVAFEHVRFSYRPDVPLIQDLSLAAQPGHTVAIVGPTGAGKTTLVNLLMRFYELDGGRILVDGVDIRRRRRGEHRRRFGMVLQDTWLFHGTIRDNIAYGKEGATDEEIRRAAVAAHADHFIRTLPGGYAFELNEEATNVSQGQRQLLTIARAILAAPAILILDEATSSVDTRTERVTQKAMLELMRDRTSFVIAHRLSTIRDAELIVVMNAGAIVETGTHAELLARQGFYADLYSSQSTPGRAPSV